MDNNNKLDKLKESIIDDANEKGVEIDEKTDSKKIQALEKAEENILEEAYQLIQNEVSDIKSEIGREISLLTMESRKEVLAEREYYVENVFSEVKKQLNKYIKSEEYVQYLKKCYQDGLKTLGKITRICVSRPDVELVRKFVDNVEVKQDLRIVVGGLIAENDGLIADYTFDKKLRAEREKFNTNTIFNVTD